MTNGCGGDHQQASPRRKVKVASPSADAAASGTHSPMPAVPAEPWVVRAWIERGLVPQDLVSEKSVLSRDDLAELHSLRLFERACRSQGKNEAHLLELQEFEAYR